MSDNVVWMKRKPAPAADGNIQALERIVRKIRNGELPNDAPMIILMDQKDVTFFTRKHLNPVRELEMLDDMRKHLSDKLKGSQ